MNTLGSIGFWISPILGDGSLAYTPPAIPEPPSVESMLLKLFIWTGILLAICIALLIISRRMQKSARAGMKAGGMEYLASVPLNRKCALHLIEANGQQIVIATDLHGLREIMPVNESFATVLQRLDTN